MSLKPARHSGTHPSLGLEITRALDEESRIATELVRLRERDRVDPIFERCGGGGRKPGDAMRE